MRRTLRLDAAQSGFHFRLILALALLVSLAPCASTQSDPSSKRAAARAQFDRAQKERTALEGRPQVDRTADAYQRVVNAFRRVYLITPHAAEVPAALVAVAELYQQMGRQFDDKYFQSAIDAYQFLLHEYPANRSREDALLTIAEIQKGDLDRPDLARKTFEEFLKLHPRSPKAEDARAALKEIAAEQAASRKLPVGPAPPSLATAQHEADRKLPQVTRIRTWNSENYTRIVISVDDAVQFESARIHEPDRIYFDLHDAKLNSTLAGKTFDVDGGFLKAVRVAQNKTGVVRVVLDVNKVKDFSAYLLSNPYRLVVDVYGEAPASVAAKKEPDLPAKPELKTEKSVATSAPPPGPMPEKKVAATGETATPPRTEATVPAEPGKAAVQPVSKSTRSVNPRTGRRPLLGPPPTPQPTKNGDRSLTRALGLKIGRIVIDAGHGGHDTGTIGPTGLMEKDLCLDVALRLGKLIQQRLPGAEVVFTRQDDTFIPLEDRTAIANQAQADLFLSIHANSSPDHNARGVETYYLNFATSQDALEVAARENSLAQGAIHELQDLVKKIARNEKVEESREFASDIQESLLKRLQRQSRGLKDRGVRKAPFVVLIGANMPSVLAEVSFLSNPSDEQSLKKPDGRQRVAEGLYHGVESYLQSLNSITFNQTKSAPLGDR
jgi:N-acetylmuramoyl-L-alanine amidase